MRKRNHRIQFMLNDFEYKKLQQNSSKSGFKTAGYLRSLVNGYNPKELPPLDYYAIINKLYLITGQLNDLSNAIKINSTIDNINFNEEAARTKQMLLNLQNALTEPERIK